MTPDQFADSYAAGRDRALQAAYRVCGDMIDAEDAVQDASVYFLERLADYDQITPSLFAEIAAKRASHLKARHGHRDGWNSHELPVGDTTDLDRILPQHADLHDARAD